MWVKVVFDPEAVGNGAGILVDLRLERGDTLGQIVCVAWQWW